MAGLVIINADDFGMAEEVTDAILECYDRQAVSSTSFMVWMEDSRRAAALIRERDLPAGLHLNLDEPFTADLPAAVRKAHDYVRPWFGAISRFLLEFNTSRAFRKHLRACIDFQLEEFRSLTRNEPTHIDGHHHMHMTWDALVSGALPRGIPVRSTTWLDTTAFSQVLAAYRRRWIAHRFASADAFFDLRHLDVFPGDGKTSLPPASSRVTVEIMAHPGAADEFAFLCSPAWRQLVATLPTGSFGDLSRRTRGAPARVPASQTVAEARIGASAVTAGVPPQPAPHA